MAATRGPLTSGVTLAMLVLATLFVAARFFTRAYIVRSIKQDDWWILAAWLTAVGFSVAICIGVSEGLGRHLVDIPVLEQDNLRRSQYAFSILYNPCLMLTKTSILVFYLSVLSKDADPIFRWLNWITLAITNVAGAALTFLSIFQCRPIAAAYLYPTPEGARCTDIVSLYLSSAPVNIITDLALLLLPMPILTGLRLPKKQKIILVVTFSAGIFVAVVDVVRIAYLQNAALDRLTVVNTENSGRRVIESTDFPWYASFSFMWSAIEVNIGIICACVPSLKPLFLRFAPNFIKDNDDASPVSSVDHERKSEPLATTNTDVNVLTHPAAFRRPAIKEYEGDDDGDYMGFLNMLSGPADDAPEGTRKSTNTSALSRTPTAESAASDFDFVRMDKNRNMLKLSNKQSLWPVAVVTTVFTVWGFAYGLLDVLNGQFQTIAGLSSGQALGLRGAYFAGYSIGPLTLGRFLLHRYGFKSCMIAGLCVYGCGTLVFWPSAVLTSYAAFVISNLIVGFGLSCLEVAANPYIALCGPLEYAEVRLNFSQAFQAVGTVCSPLLAQRVLFKNILNAPSLVNVQWAYLGIGLFVFALAIMFFYIPLPEASEDQLEEQADKRSAVHRTRVGPFRVVWVTLALGVFAQWCYVGGQEGNGSSTGRLLVLLRSDRDLDVQDFETLNRTTFAVGRFIGAFLNYMIKPRWLLIGCFAGCIVLSALQMSASGHAGLAVSNLLSLFEGSIFPVVYAMCMRGMGDQTFNASAFMTASISSGAVVPPMVWAVTNARGVRYSYSVVLAVFVFGALFPIYLNLVPAAKKQVDPIHETRDKRRRTKAALRANSTWTTGTTASDSTVPERKFGLAGIIARRKKQHGKQNSNSSLQMPVAEHVEQMSERAPDSPYTPKQSRFDESSLTMPSPVRTKSAQTDTSFAPWPAALSESGSSHAKSSGSGENLSPMPTHEIRQWTEEDDIREDYHKALKGL